MKKATYNTLPSPCWLLEESLLLKNLEQINPIRELASMQDILQISPFEKDLNTENFMKLVSTNVQDFLLTTKKHPKLLVPFALE